MRTDGDDACGNGDSFPRFAGDNELIVGGAHAPSRVGFGASPKHPFILKLKFMPTKASAPARRS